MHHICFLIFAVHKLCRTLENSTLDFEVSITRFCFLYYTQICEYIFTELVSAAVQSNVCESVNGCDTLLNKPRISVLH